MISKINETLQEINKLERCSLFHQDITNRFTIIDLVQNKACREKFNIEIVHKPSAKCNNAFTLLDGSVVYLSNDSVDILYQYMVLLNTEQLPRNSVEDTIQYVKRVKNYSKTFNNQSVLRKTINEAIETVKNIDGATSKNISILKYLLTDESKTENIPKHIENTIHYKLKASLNARDDKQSNVHMIPRTSLCIDVAKTLLERKIKLIPVLGKFFEYLTDTEKSFTKSETTVIRSFIHAALQTNGDVHLKDFFNTTSTNLSKFDNLVAITILIKAVSRKNRDRLTKINLDEEIIQKNIANKFSWMSVQSSYVLGIGNHFVEALIQTGQFTPYQANNTSTHFIQIGKDIYYSLTKGIVMDTPYISLTNIKYVKKLGKNPKSIFNNYAKRNRANVHVPHDGFSLTPRIPKKSLQTVQYLSIDTLFFSEILDMIIILGNYKYHMLPTNMQQYFDTLLFSHYDVTHEDVERLKQFMIGHNIDADDLHDNIFYNFSKETSVYALLNELRIKMRKIKDAQWNYIERLLERIAQKKHYFIESITRAIMDSLFDHIIITHFMDYRGRQYPEEIALNYQNNPVIRALIKLRYSHEYVDYPLLKAALKKHLRYHGPKNTVDNLTFSNEANTQLFLNQIYALFKIPEDQCKKFITDEIYEDKALLLAEITKYIKPKKAREIVLVHSQILYERSRYRNQNPRRISNNFNLDASTSGLQMIGILFRNPEIAKVSNLVGEKKEDVYTQVAESCNNDLIAHLNKVEELVSLWNYDKKEFHKYFHLSNRKTISLNDFNDIPFKTKYNLVHAFITVDLDLSIDFKRILHKMYPLTFGSQDPAILSCLKTLDVYKNYVTKAISTQASYISKDYTLPYKNKEEIEALFILRQLFRYYFLCAYDADMTITIYNPKHASSIWHTREPYKNAVMTYFYGATSYRRSINFKKIIEESFSLHEQPRYGKQEFIYVLEKAFQRTIDWFPYFKLLKGLVDILVKPGTAITFENEHFKLGISPQKTKKIQIGCKGHRGSRVQLVLHQLLDEIDKNKLERSLSANIIHSMDASIIHYLHDLVDKINQTLLKSKKLHKYQIQIYTIHDSIFCNNPQILKILLHESYLRLADEGYLSHFPLEAQKLASLSIKEFVMLLQNINPNFVK
jgi:hypothetical protein